MPVAALTPEPRELPDATEAFSWYRPLVEGFEMAAPMLVVGGDEGQVSMPLDEWENVPDGVVSAVAMGRLYGFTPTWLLVSSEAWQRSFDRDEAGWEAVADAMQHGDLEKAADLGDTRVKEIVSIWGRRADGTGYIARCEFHRSDAGVTWGELESHELDEGGVELGGAMLAAMTHALEHKVVSHESPDRPDLRMRRST